MPHQYVQTVRTIMGWSSTMRGRIIKCTGIHIPTNLIYKQTGIVPQHGTYVMSSSVRSLSFPEVCNKISVTDLIGRVPKDVEVLYLGHDGVIYVSSTKDDDGYIIGYQRDSAHARASFTALIAGLPKL